MTGNLLTCLYSVIDNLPETLILVNARYPEWLRKAVELAHNKLV